MKPVQQLQVWVAGEVGRFIVDILMEMAKTPVCFQRVLKRTGSAVHPRKKVGFALTPAQLAVLLEGNDR